MAMRDPNFLQASVNTSRSQYFPNSTSKHPRQHPERVGQKEAINSEDLPVSPPQDLKKTWATHVVQKKHAFLVNSSILLTIL